MSSRRGYGPIGHTVPVSAPTLTTERLSLRPWHEANRKPFARLNANPWVTERLPTTLGRAESDVKTAAQAR